MKARNLRVVILCVALLILAAGPGLAGSSPPAPNPETTAGTDAITNSPWFIETIEAGGEVGQHVSIAIHASNVPYISYYDATNKDLRVTHYVGSGGNCGEDNDWFCEVVDDGGVTGDDVGKYNSIAVNPTTGHPAIAYQDVTNGALKYAWRLCYPTCHWITETVDLRPTLNQCSRGLYTSLAFADDSTPVISHYCAGLLNYGELRTAIADSGGDGNCGEGDAAGDWQCDVVDSGTGVGRYTSLQAYYWSDSLYVIISYYDQENGDLKAADYTGPPPGKLVDGAIPTGNCGPGDTWNCVTIDSTGDVGRYTSMGLGGIGIAYYDVTHGALKYAMHDLRDTDSPGNCGPANDWQCDIIDTMGSSILPMGLSLGGSYSNPVIAYQSIPDEFAPGTLKVARPAAVLGLPYGNCGPEDPYATWQCETIDRGSDIFYEASYVALAVHQTGLVTIAYHEEDDYFNTDNLKVAYQRIQAFLPLLARGEQ